MERLAFGGALVTLLAASGKEVQLMASTRKKTPRLGRGLSSLMGTSSVVDGAAMKKSDLARTPEGSAAIEAREQVIAAASVLPPSASDRSPSADEGLGGVDSLRYLSIEVIKPNPHQPRRDFSDAGLRRLADSLKAEGLMQPIVVRPAGGGPLPAAVEDQAGGSFELVAGERRWRAAQLAGLDQIPAIVRELDDQQIAEWSLIENLQREDLNPIERAEAFRNLHQQFGLSHDQIAAHVGLNRATISNFLRLLGLSEDVRQLVREGLLSMGQARALAGLSDPQQQVFLAKQVVREGVSVRELEARIRRLSGIVQRSSGSERTRPVHLTDLERQIGQQIGTRVAIRQGRKKGAGRITIDFYSLGQFEGLLSRLGVKID